MKSNLGLFAAICALAAWPCAAQETTATVQGPATLVLPQKLVAGQPATLAVLDAEGRLTAGAVVEFSGGARVTTDSTGRALFTAPAQPGVLLAKVAGSTVQASAIVILLPENLPDGIQVDDVARVVSLHDRFQVGGSGFRGEADANRATLGDQPALVLASSPVALVLVAGPRVSPGLAQLVVEVGGRSPGPFPVVLVALEVEAEKQPVAPKEKGKLTVRVRGTEQRLEVEVRNLTPEAVKLDRGNQQRLRTSGGENNIAVLELQGRRSGDFSVSARLVPAAVGLPDTEAARQQLLAARRMAPLGWGWRLDRLIRRLEEQPQDAWKVSRDLKKILAKAPSGEFSTRLEAARRILLAR